MCGEGHHRARFALQESMSGWLPTADGTRALSMQGEHWGVGAERRPGGSVDLVIHALMCKMGEFEL